MGPPSGFSYVQPPPLLLNETITPLMPTVTGPVTAYSVSPLLPTGLTLDTSTGVISGTPTALSAAASYQIVATNFSGHTSASISISVVNGGIAYPSAYLAYTVGVAAQMIAPTVRGATFTTWSVSPALPSGLVLSTTTGSISGQPTAAAAPINYTITAKDAVQEESTTVTIAVAGGHLLDLGLSSEVTFLRYANSSVLSQDFTDRWLLQDFTTGATLATADTSGAVLADGFGSYVDLENNTMIDEASAGLEARSATTGQVLATIPYPAQVAWFRLASDGSYVAAGTPTALIAWSTSGQVLFTRSGNYSQAVPFAAPGQIQIAQGPAGQNVIETVSTANGTSTVSPTFQGVFNSWFIDGRRFLANQSTTVWVYSNSAVQQNLTTVNTFTQLTGQNNYFWTFNANGTEVVRVYAVGSNAGPILTAPTGVDSVAIPSANTIGVLAYGTGQVTIIDLSGAMPVVSAPYNVPYAYLSAYAAQSASQWLVGDSFGVLFDGTSIGNPRALTLGTAWSVVAGTSYISVTTAAGKILYFNSSDDTQAGTIKYSSSQLSASSDGTVLAAAGNTDDAQYETPQGVNIYSLPSGTTTHTFAQTSMVLAQTGTVIALGNGSSGSTCSDEVMVVPVMGGAPVFCLSGNVLFSPNATLTAAAPPASATAATNIYLNGTLTTAVPGVGAGWLDNNRLVVNEYTNDTVLVGPQPNGALIFDAAGHQLGSVPFLGVDPFQVVSATDNTVYDLTTNRIVSLTTGATTWASANMARQSDSGALSGPAGGITSTQVIFVSDNVVLAQPY